MYCHNMVTRVRTKITAVTREAAAHTYLSWVSPDRYRDMFHDNNIIVSVIKKMIRCKDS
jgi:hypothetical protein